MPIYRVGMNVLTKIKYEGRRMTLNCEVLTKLQAVSDAQLLETIQACIRTDAARLFHKCEAERVRRIEWRQAHG